MVSYLRQIETKNDPNARLLWIMEQIDRNIDEFKSKQALSGASGMKAYNTENPGTDYEQVVTSPSSTYGRSVRLTTDWQADGSQEFPFTSPFVNFFANGEKIDSRTWYWTNGSSSVRLQSLLVMDGMNLNTSYSRRWTSEAVVFGSVTIGIKSWVFGTSPGTLTTEVTLI
ncbi:hypothetical protein [Dietzia sp. MNB45]|uniref:hypothetical protein n=1 Tax=Dietzia sp. MNB45 TaxID=3238800 RepID=UPI003F7E96EF